MVNKRNIRECGKLKLSRYFQEFDEGESVAILKEISMQPRFPKRLQGKTGKIEGKRGKSYIVNIKDQDKEKKFIIDPIHLKKIKTIKKNDKKK